MTYEYRCPHCVTVFERQRSMSDYEQAIACPACGAEAEQHFSSERRFDVHFLGHSGWDSTGGQY